MGKYGSINSLSPQTMLIKAPGSTSLILSIIEKSPLILFLITISKFVFSQEKLVFKTNRVISE